MPTPTTTAANESLANASASLNTTIGTTTDLVPVVVLLLYVVGALLAAQVIAPWLATSALLSKVSKGILESLGYAIKGIAATAVLAVGALPVYLLATADGGTRGMVLEAVVFLAAGYVLMVIFGVLADQAVTTFISAHPDIDEWADITPDDEDQTEAVTDSEVIRKNEGGDP